MTTSFGLLKFRCEMMNSPSICDAFEGLALPQSEIECLGHCVIQI